MMKLSIFFVGGGTAARNQEVLFGLFAAVWLFAYARIICLRNVVMKSHESVNLTN